MKQHISMPKKKNKLKFPKDWKVYRLGDLGDFLKGKGISKKDRKESGIPCILYGEIYTKHHFYVKEFVSFIDNKTASKSMRLEKGDILFTGSGETREEIGKPVAYLDDREAYAGGDIIILRPKNINSLFLSYLLNSEHQIKERARLAEGHSVVHIYPNELKSIRVYIPTLLEQKKIAAILSTWDKAIELKEKLIEQKKELKKGLMQKLLTGEVRLAGRRETIKHLKLKGLIKEINERNTKNKITNVLSVTNSNGFILQSEQFGRQIASKDLSNYKIVRKEQFAYNPSRVNVGSIDLLKNFDVGILSPMYVIFETIEEKLLPNYLYHFLKSNLFLNQLDGLLQGSVRQSLNFKSLEQVKLFVPDLTEQREISEFLDLFDEQLSLLQLELDNLQEQKKGLMQLLLTGKVRVKV